MVFTALIVAFCLAGTIFSDVPGRDAEQIHPRLAPFSFLLGSWQAEFRGQRLYEEWRLTAPDRMDGRGYIVRADGDTLLTEQVAIVVEKDVVTYIANVAHNEEAVHFAFQASKDDSFVFANPDHDFPQRIIYEKSADAGILNARIEGDAEDGSVRRVDYAFRRIAD